MLKEKDLVVAVAKDVEAVGGTMYNVGGYVRDKILKRDSKDIDVETHGITYHQFKDILSKYGEVDEVGASFGVLMVKGFDIDFTMPRTETKVGDGHKGFDVSIEPFMGTENACRRRDFRFNAIMEEVLTGTIVDHFNGISELNEGIISHVDTNSFIEDPLRVFRACQFASRFDFEIYNETMKLCSQIDITSLPRERVLNELEKAILKSEKPSIFFYNLKKMDKLKPYFNELDNLSDNLFEFAMKQVDKLENKSMESVLTIICYYLTGIDKFLSRFTNETNLIKGIKQNINTITKLSSDLNEIKMRRFAYSALNKEDLIKDVVKAITSDEFYPLFVKAFDLATKEVRVPLITSKDLFELGYKPGKDFGDKLKQCMNFQIEGCSKEEILKFL